MYQQEKSSWLKHWDFILLDIVCLQIAYVAAYVIRHGFLSPYADSWYRNMAVVITLVQLCAGFLLESYKNILRRGYFEEFKQTAILVSVEILFTFAYLFITKTSRIFSRAVFLELWVLAILLIYVVRLWRKSAVRKKMQNTQYLQSLVLVTKRERAEEIIRALGAKEYSGFYIRAVILADEENTENDILNIPVISGDIEALNYLRENVVDEVFVDIGYKSWMRDEILNACDEMGITTHLNVEEILPNVHHAIVENFAGHIVITSSINFADSRQLLVKRIMDICGGIAGLILTGIILIIFGPVIYVQSPGPVFFSQERVGRNGRKFKIYKFRSMYLDAEERKKELMAQNKMQGFMFKMDNDPRIIPIGRFMRKTSLDEFPQFWNVLKGDMSLVGTLPPTVDEYEQYELHHKARLAAKPGLTGMWQVSGRSDIVDFEEVVSLDKKYITEWNIGMDFKILFQTVKIVITGKGSV